MQTTGVRLYRRKRKLLCPPTFARGVASGAMTPPMHRPFREPTDKTQSVAAAGSERLGADRNKTPRSSNEIVRKKLAAILGFPRLSGLSSSANYSRSHLLVTTINSRVLMIVRSSGSLPMLIPAIKHFRFLFFLIKLGNVARFKIKRGLALENPADPSRVSHPSAVASDLATTFGLDIVG